jgi:predicted NBD/HSP70 family sugar kinase
VVGLGGVVHSITRHSLADPLPAKDTAEIMASMIETAGRSLTPGQRIVGVGVAVPGLVSHSDGLVRLAPHLDWHDEPFAAMLQQLTGLPVSAANDAHLGARAEGAFGAARDAQDMLYLNGGASGIGGGIIASGVPIAGANGYAGELGHTMVNPYGIACHCGAVGCLETEVRRDRLLEVTGLDPESADRLPEHLASSEDSRVSAEVARQLDFLTVALRNGINTLNPQLVILGGFLGPLFAADSARLKGFAANRPLSAPRDSVTIRSSTLGSELLLLGAGELAFEALLADPASF